MNVELIRAAQQALSALEKSQPHPSNPVIGLTNQDFIDHEKTIRQLRTAIQQAEAKVNEPVWFHKNWGEYDDIFYRPNDVIPDGSTPLYATPQPATASACNIPGMAKTTCPYCEQGFSFEYTK